MYVARPTLIFALALTLTLSSSLSSFAGAADQRGAPASPTAVSWAQLAKFAPSGGFPTFFGSSVAVSGNTVAVGATVTSSNQLNGSGAVYVYVKPATGWGNMTQVAVLSPSDGAFCDQFGASVSISGNTIVVGAPQNYAVCAPNGAGAAYVFVEPAVGWSGTLTETAKLTASDGVTGDALGNSVAIAGSTVVAGAPGTNPSISPGAAYVFTEPAGGWATSTQTAKLTASDGQAGDELGFSVSASGNTVAAGAPGALIGANPAQGAAYVFVKPPSGWTNATQAAKLTASDGNVAATLGQSISLSGNTVAAGAPGSTIGANQAQGAAYLFVEPVGGWMNMMQTAKLTAAPGYAGDLFGSAVSISANTLVAGAPYFQKGQSPGAYFHEGATYIFVKPASGWSTSSSSVYLTGSDAKFAAYLGSGVAVSGNLVMAGAPFLAHFSGGAYLFILQ